MSILYYHTQLLEHLDWDDDLVDEAISRTIEIYKELCCDSDEVNVLDLKKLLREEYSNDVVESLVLFFDATRKFEEELKKHEEEIE